MESKYGTVVAMILLLLFVFLLIEVRVPVNVICETETGTKHYHAYTSLLDKQLKNHNAKTYTAIDLNESEVINFEYGIWGEECKLHW